MIALAVYTSIYFNIKSIFKKKGNITFVQSMQKTIEEKNILLLLKMTLCIIIDL